MYFVYDLLGRIILLFSPIIFLFRILSRKEDLKRIKEKYCIYPKKNRKNKTIWFHAVSIGEIMTIIPVIKKLENKLKVKKILITSSTKSSTLILSKYKFKKTVHKYFPLDTNYLSNKFIKHWKPQVAIFIDSEIWPNMFKNLYLNKIPLILLNARITKKTFKKWQIFPSFAKIVFSKITLAMPQNSETLKYLKKN